MFLLSTSKWCSICRRLERFLCSTNYKQLADSATDFQTRQIQISYGYEVPLHHNRMRASRNYSQSYTWCQSEAHDKHQSSKQVRRLWLCSVSCQAAISPGGSKRVNLQHAWILYSEHRSAFYYSDIENLIVAKMRAVDPRCGNPSLREGLEQKEYKWRPSCCTHIGWSSSFRSHRITSVVGQRNSEFV